jgi:hypothetical protein
MLPGFRFLLAAIVLSMSVLVFGLGAAALLRAAHEEFASTPAWRVAPEPKFAQQNEAPTEPPREILGEISLGEISRESFREESMPMLGMLRVEPAPAQPSATDSIPAVTAPAEPPPIAPMPDQPEQIVALEPLDEPPPEAAKPEIPVPEISMQSEALAADVPAPAPAEEARIVTTEQATVEQVLPPAIESVAPAPPEPAIVPPAAHTDIIAARIATLGSPHVAIEKQPPAKTVAKPDQSIVKKRLQARRAVERRRKALRAREAAAQQQAADPFAQPAITTRSR